MMGITLCPSSNLPMSYESLTSCLSDFRLDMPYSPTLNAESSIRTQLTPFLQAWEASASWGERITLMRGFTSTLSSILASNSAPMTNGVLMLTAATRMCHHLEEHPQRVTIMRSRMARLLRGSLSDQMEAEFLRLASTGVESQMLKVCLSFGDWLENWLHELFLPTTNLSVPTPIGTIVPNEMHMGRQRASVLLWNELRNSLNGYTTMCLEVL